HADVADCNDVYKYQSIEAVKMVSVLATSTKGAFVATFGKNAISIDTDGVRMQINSLRKDMRSDLCSIKSTATLEMGERSRPVVHVHNHGDVDMIRTEIEHRDAVDASTNYFNR